MKISVLNYEAGNSKSIINAIEYIGYDANLTNDRKEILNSDKFIIPGQGSSLHLMYFLKKNLLIDTIKEFSLHKKKSTLGICVGMQIFFKDLTENETHNGLHFFEGNVVKIDSKHNIKIPNIGWHDVEIKNKKLYDKVGDKNQFYHCHSYICNFDDELELCSTNCSDIKIKTGVMRDNIVGFQFHPEKSQEGGHRLLDWFLKL